MRKYFLFFIITFIFFVFQNNTFLSAKEIIISNNSYAYEDQSDIKIYRNNIYFKKIADSKLLDMNENYILYNNNNNLYLYDFDDDTSKIISNEAYNALIDNNYIIYESTKHNYTCNDYIINYKKRNCYRLFIYDLLTEEEKILELIGEDNYLNDFENNYLIYTSSHYHDYLCSNLCSFINLYQINDSTNLTLNTYYDLQLDMSGNGYLDNESLYFESYLDLYECNHLQIFRYDLKNKFISLITQTNGKCFTSNSEIITAKNDYLIFSSDYNNYQNREQINYVYSKEDELFSKVNVACLSNKNIAINDLNIICLKDEVLNEYKIDSDPPIIKSDKTYFGLLNNETKFINQLEYYDNLSKRENIIVNLLEPLELDKDTINVELCDRFNNCLVETIYVEVAKEDLIAPLIYCKEKITIKLNEAFDINKYGHGYDLIDGNLPLFIKNEIDTRKKGSYMIEVCCKDMSNNVSSKLVEVVIYDEFKNFIIYYFFLTLSFMMIIIIYIFRFKKRV